MGMKVFELYSGIGGMHFALKDSGIDAEIVRAIDINTTANSVYRENFPKSKLLEKNIQSLIPDDFNKLDVEMILMSPPCQPFSRNGLRQDKADKRSESLLHIIDLIPELKTVKYILLENVKGFEISAVRNKLIEVLLQSDFLFQEFLLTPTQFAIPNSRLRYYLLAKKKPLEFCFQRNDLIFEELPKLRNDVMESVTKLNWKYKRLCLNDSCFQIGLILDAGNIVTIPENILMKYGSLFDIVTKESTRSCCFTKGYTHFVEGTGSVLSLKDCNFIRNVFDELKDHGKDSVRFLELLKSLELRYFLPKEISALMCFPESFIFPEHLSERQKFRLLGNSINVHIVSVLLSIKCIEETSHFNWKSKKKCPATAFCQDIGSSPKVKLLWSLSRICCYMTILLSVVHLHCFLLITYIYSDMLLFICQF